MAKAEWVKFGSFQERNIPVDPIIAHVRGSISELFTKAIGAMASDVEKTLSKNSGGNPAIEKVVADVTCAMIALLADQVAATLPVPPSGTAKKRGSAKAKASRKRKTPHKP